ncbi:MAG: DUF1738 domain-containing protein [Ruminococcus sp.]|nr:DUF1738 domain-containing protein [Ruminococcus sp.]
MADKLNQVAIRMVEQPPLYSKEPMNSPEAAIHVMQEFLSEMDRELFCIVNLQSDLKPINMNIVSVGTLNQSISHPREVFKSAILSNAAGILLIHNHPSGNLTPSKEDIYITDRLRQAGELLGIQLFDHIITGPEKEYFSFQERRTLSGSSPRFVSDLEELQIPRMVAETDQVREQPSEYVSEPVSSSTRALPRPGKDMDSILESLKAGVEDLFTSERYADYLKTMAKFHNYSFNNTILIAMQRPDATLVTGYKNWQSMGRQVKKGEKGITIIAPAPVKCKKQRKVLDQEQRPVFDEQGNPVLEEVEVKIPRFKAITVFDIAQTTGEPIELLAPKELQEAVNDYALFMRAITEISIVPIRFDEIPGGAKGYYHNVNKEIVIQQGMSESQTIKTAIHESSHARLHDKDLMESRGEEKDRLTKEVEAESVAYCVCSALGLDTSEYSFPYIAGWSSGKNMKELKSSMDVIRQTAGEMIDELNDKIVELVEEKQKEKLIPAMEAAGYRFDEMGSTKEQLCFIPDGVHQISGVMLSQSWDEVQEWLENVLAKDSIDAERVERILYPEHYHKTSEEMMYANEGDRFSLYQIRDGSAAEEHKFLGMDTLKEQGITINASEYECVYSGLLLPSDDLHTLYSMFNDNPPADFKAHSMSVSDVVVMNRNHELQAFYVDRFGFTELPEFATEKKRELIDNRDPKISDILDDRNRISFYAAECSEFPVLGEVHCDLTLTDAFQAYDKIPDHRMNGIKGIGFDLKDGSEWEGSFPLVTGGKIDKELINSIPGFRENKLVQEAVSRAENILKSRNPEKALPDPSQKDKTKEEKKQIKKGDMCL